MSSSDAWIAVLAGAASGFLTSGLNIFADRKRARADATRMLGEAERAEAEAGKARAETQEILLRLKQTEEQAKSDSVELTSRVANAEASIAYERARRQDIVVFSSPDGGFSPFAFTSELVDGALAELQHASRESEDDILVLLRHNNAGRVFIFLKSYSYDANPDAIPVGTDGGARRTLRAQGQVRAMGAEHTFLLTLKQLGAPVGIHLADRRIRVQSAEWKDFDAAFDITPTADFRLRMEDRSVSSAPSQLELRRLVITERDAPPSVLGSAAERITGL